MQMPPRSPKQTRAWLQRRPSLDELRAAFPADWETVQRELAEMIGRNDLEALKAYAVGLSAAPAADVRTQVRRQLAAEAIKQLCLSAATGVSSGKVRFNLLNGWVAQQLLFEHDLERKPVSLPLFRLVWPLLWQRRLLLPLVQPKGIYCFYSSQLVRALATLIGDRSCLEIAAGDGTLSRFLAAEGVAVTATDDQSWNHAIAFPSTVLREDAKAALRAHRPEAVLCSWPPAGNPFEQAVFETDSVQLYVAINSGLELGSGNRQAYARQTRFDVAEEPALSRLVLPPELGAVVHVFRRRPGA